MLLFSSKLDIYSPTAYCAVGRGAPPTLLPLGKRETDVCVVYLSTLRVIEKHDGPNNGVSGAEVCFIIDRFPQWAAELLFLKLVWIHGPFTILVTFLARFSAAFFIVYSLQFDRGVVYGLGTLESGPALVAVMQIRVVVVVVVHRQCENRKHVRAALYVNATHSLALGLYVNSKRKRREGVRIETNEKKCIVFCVSVCCS